MLHNVIIEQRLSGMVVYTVFSILAIISMGKRDCCFTLIVCRCHVIVSVLRLILSVKWGGLKCGVMKFPGHIFFSGIQLYLLLSPYLCFISFLYLDLYVLGND